MICCCITLVLISTCIFWYLLSFNYCFLFRDSALGSLTSSEWSRYLIHPDLFFLNHAYSVWDSNSSCMCLCVCVFQWGKNKSQVWHGCCSLPVLPASSDHPAGSHHCHLPWNYTACQFDRRPAQWVTPECLVWQGLYTHGQRDNGMVTAKLSIL